MGKKHVTVRIDGPVIPAGNVYCVVYGAGVTSNRASLAVCMAVAKDWNRSHKSQAYVKHVGAEKAQ